MEERRGMMQEHQQKYIMSILSYCGVQKLSLKSLTALKVVMPAQTEVTV